MIHVKKKGFEEPYSRWKITESMTSAGLDRTRAYELALAIQKELKERQVKEIEEDDLRSIVFEKLDGIDNGIAEKYVIWNRVRHEKIPIIILIGGTSGIGKSSVALELAHRLGIKQVIGTDTIREIMRNIIAPNIMPELHQSSYEAWKAISFKVKEDKVVVGFREQARAVSAGINAAIERSLTEGISLVIEGVHMVP
ncbi:MAG TPA: ATP cone domain-containing protein, partial [Candidatus Methanofastidiosa archaeon]|nr:ATP cone domain-containing protein [Candidatus Methanofastidiosa archaeon]